MPFAVESRCGGTAHDFIYFTSFGLEFDIQNRFGNRMVAAVSSGEVSGESLASGLLIGL